MVLSYADPKGFIEPQVLNPSGLFFVVFLLGFGQKIGQIAKNKGDL